MDRSIAAFDVQPNAGLDAIAFSGTSERSYAPSCEPAVDAANGATNDGTNEDLDGCEQDSPRLTPVDELLKVEHWRPAEPQFCKAIAAHYGQSRRTIQKWYVDLREIAPFFSEDELRLNDDRYTALAVELLGHRYFAGSKKAWAEKLNALYADRIQSWEVSQESAAICPEVMPQQANAGNYGLTVHSSSTPGLPGVLVSQQQCEQNNVADCPQESPEISSGLVLHLGSDLALPEIRTIVPSDADYLSQFRKQLEEFENLEEQTLAEMQEELEKLETENALFQEGLSLSDQLLLRQYQLKGVKLGFQAIAAKQQAFKATVQAAEAGSIPSPGKSTPDDEQAA